MSRELVQSAALLQNVTAPRLAAGLEGPFNSQLSALVQKLQTLASSPLLNGEYIDWRTFTSATEIRHSLGRRPAGVLVVKRPLAVDVGAALPTAWNDRRIYMVSDTADADVRLYVW